MVFNEENLDQLLPDVEAITKRHYNDVATYKDIPLDPDFEKYRLIESVGNARCYTIRDDVGLLKGYAVFFLSYSLQYKSSYQAVQDLIYIDSELRGQGIGKDFILFVDNHLRDEGVQLVFHHTKVAKSFAPLLEHIGYSHVDSIYARRLDLCVPEQSL